VVSLGTPSKVTKLYVAFIVKQEVLWFQIPVNDSLLLDVVDSETSLEKVNERVVFSELVFLPQKME
jgi:hypothetical protein